MTHPLEPFVRAVLEKARDQIADYPRVAPDGTEAQHYDEQIDHSQACLDALDADQIAAELAHLVPEVEEVERLRDFVADFAAAKIDALPHSPRAGSSPEDDPDPVCDAETVWAWQADAEILGRKK